MRKKRPMRKQERERFVKLATQLLLDLGAQQSDWIGYEFAIRTKVGLLHLLVKENTTQGPGTVFTRFDDPEAARESVDCNPASGKWNHFYFEGTVEEAIENLSFWLRRIMR
jgi:hypothetical protein